MKKINKATVAWEGLKSRVCYVIKDWTPGDLKNERAYRDSLAEYIQECAPEAHIECEYRHLGTTIDIFVKWKGIFSDDQIFIELKRNLTQKTEFNRLVGQIEDLQPEKHNVIIVLCGTTSPALLNRLKEKYQSWSPSMLTKPSTAIIPKPQIIPQG
jgi:hypothetical protein